MASKKNRYEEVNLSEFDGVRYLHLGYTPWVQGAMRIARPWKLEIEYTRDMMCWQQHAHERALTVKRIVQLGLGAGSLSKYCYRECLDASITVVEINPQVIAACRQFFKLPPDDARLKVTQASADAWVNDVRNHGCADVLQVDLYDASAQGPVFDDVAFYTACRACLSPHGMMTVNVFGGDAMPALSGASDGSTGGSDKAGTLENKRSTARGFKHSYANISAAFEGCCTALPAVDAGNVVVLAWKQAPA